MGYVKVEYGARPGFFCPGQKRFIVPFDQADRAVNRFDIVLKSSRMSAKNDASSFRGTYSSDIISDPGTPTRIVLSSDR